MTRAQAQVGLGMGGLGPTHRGSLRERKGLRQKGVCTRWTRKGRGKAVLKGETKYSLSTALGQGPGASDGTLLMHFTCNPQLVPPVLKQLCEPLPQLHLL